jgi:radical SAM superfamily enzyme YgiQ (UPF0313 family)
MQVTPIANANKPIHGKWPLPERKPVKIYLADLAHNWVNSKDYWVIPLGIGTVSSYCREHIGEDAAEWSLFKFPDKLIAAIEEVPPDILGLSHYLWNAQLMRLISREVKRRFPNTLVVVGGPNLTQTKEWMGDFFADTKADFHTSWAGEAPFLQIVNARMKPESSFDSIQRDSALHGVWRLNPDNGHAEEIKIAKTIKNLDDIPSPYLNHSFDHLLADGLTPMLETTRGCPFKCTFCDWGNATMGKVTAYSVERLKQDLEYIAVHTKDERLDIADANFGILKKQHLELSRYIAELSQRTGYPDKIINTWNQKKTNAMLQMADYLKDMCMMTTSSQSLNASVLENIKRYNITHEEWLKLKPFCSQRGIEMYCDLIFALPSETMQSYLDGIRYLFDVGVDYLVISSLCLLEGAEMNTAAERQTYDMQTRFRLLENSYGVYWGQPTIEYEEIVVANRDLSFADHMFNRMLSWLVQMSWNLRNHDTVIRLLFAKAGINPLDFFVRVIEARKTAPMVVQKIFDDFDAEAHAELFPSAEALIAHYSQPDELGHLQNGGFRRMNTAYTSRVSIECAKEMVEYYGQIAKSLAFDAGKFDATLECMIDDSIAFSSQRYINVEECAMLRENKMPEKQIEVLFDVHSFVKPGANPNPNAHMQSEPLTLQFYIKPEQAALIREHLQRFDGINQEYQMRKLQDPRHGINKRHLLFHVKRQESASLLS